MNTKIYALILLLIFALSGCTDLPPAMQSQSAPQSGSVTLVDENGNRIQLETDNENHALLQIFSEPGHGAVHINVPNATYPNQITLRLHLAGLEELTIEYDGDIHLISLSSSGDQTIRQSITAAAQTRELTTDASEWATVELVEPGGASAQPTIPLDSGYIDVTLSQAFMGRQIRNLSIKWIDFYR